MSVIRSKRSTSDMQFLNTARELESKTRHRCVNGPKRYTFYGLKELWETARRIHAGVKEANSVFPTNQHEVQIRRDYFIKAHSSCQDYISQIELFLEDGIFTPEIVEELMALVDAEITLIKAVMKSDKARYKELP